MSLEHIPLSLQRRVRLRAGNHCEHCGISQAGQEATFHVDHVKPRREHGPTTLENLALCCVSCSLRKGARTHAPDPSTGEVVPLFNPREQRWEEHFELLPTFELSGKTPGGRASIALLQMNRPVAIEIRRALSRRSPEP